MAHMKESKTAGWSSRGLGIVEAGLLLVDRPATCAEAAYSIWAYKMRVKKRAPLIYPWIVILFAGPPNRDPIFWQPTLALSMDRFATRAAGCAALAAFHAPSPWYRQAFRVQG